MIDHSSTAERSTIASAESKAADPLQALDALSQTALHPDQFYPIFADLLLRATHGKWVRVWRTSASEILPVSETSNAPKVDAEISERVATAVRLGTPIVHVLERPNFEQHHADSPPDRLFLMPVRVNGEEAPTEVIEVCRTERPSNDGRSSTVRFLVQIAGLVTAWKLRTEISQLRNKDRDQRAAARLGEYLHGTLDLNQCAYRVANEVRRITGVDRVTLFLIRNHRMFPAAVSGQTTFNSRAPEIRELRRNADHCASSSAMIWYPTNDELDIPPSLEETIKRHVEVSFTRQLVVVPMRFVSGSSGIEASDTPASHPHRAMGVMVLETFGEPLDRNRLQYQLERLSEFVSPPLENALIHSRTLLVPGQKALSRLLGLYQGRTMPWAWLTTAVALVLLACAIFVPDDLTVTGNGTLEVVGQRHVFADVEGVISEIHVHTGDLVKADDPILTLKNPDLEARIAQLEGELRETNERRQSIRTDRLRRNHSNPNVSAASLAAEDAAAETRMATLIAELEILYRKRELLVVRSPIGGQVLTWNADELLSDRPVQIGQQLLTIAPQSDQWRLEVNIADRNFGPIMEQVNQGKSPRVSYVLLAEPNIKRFGIVDSIQTYSEVTPDDGSVVRLFVRPEPDSRPTIARNGATLVAHVHCGQTSWLHARTHEAKRWLQRQMFRWF